jgi:outer membrane protein TolC
MAGEALDLVRLASEYTEATGSAKLAKRQLEIIRLNHERGSVSESELATAEVQLETASNKVRLLRGIAEAAADATSSELEYVRRMVEKGYMPASGEVQARARLRILQMILSDKPNL